MNHQINENGTVTIKKENRVIGTGQTEGRMFLLDIVSSTNSKADTTMIAKTQNSSTTELWHRRLGHINHSSLKKVQKMVDGLEDQKLDEENSICEACIYGKQHRTPNHEEMERATAKLDRIRSEERRVGKECRYRWTTEH